MLKRVCVYKITSPKKRVYIGSTLDFESRIGNYKRLQCKSQSRLYYSLKKYGFDKHKIEILCHCDPEDVRQKEAYYGQLYDCLGEYGLNCYLPKHDGFTSASKETKVKMALAKIGKPRSEETRKKIGDFNRGRVLTEEQKKPHKGANKGHKHSEAFKTAISERFKGKKLSEDHILKRSLSVFKILVNKETGIFYYGYKEAAESTNIPEHTFKTWIRRQKPIPFIITE